MRRAFELHSCEWGKSKEVSSHALVFINYVKSLDDMLFKNRISSLMFLFLSEFWWNRKVRFAAIFALLKVLNNLFKLKKYPHPFWVSSQKKIQFCLKDLSTYTQNKLWASRLTLDLCCGFEQKIPLILTDSFYTAMVTKIWNIFFIYQGKLLGQCFSQNLLWTFKYCDLWVWWVDVV